MSPAHLTAVGPDDKSEKPRSKRVVEQYFPPPPASAPTSVSIFDDPVDTDKQDEEVVVLSQHTQQKQPGDCPLLLRGNCPQGV